MKPICANGGEELDDLGALLFSSPEGNDLKG